MKKKIVRIVSGLLAAAGIIASNAASIGCLFIIIDEPSAPASIIE